MTFIAEHGLVRYTPEIGLTKMHHGKPCEACAKPSRGLDHCHIHGWIRGPLCGGCNVRMQAIDARKPRHHDPALLKHWANCPDCAADGPWTPGEPPTERPYRGRKVSVYLSTATCSGPTGTTSSGSTRLHPGVVAARSGPTSPTRITTWIASHFGSTPAM